MEEHKIAKVSVIWRGRMDGWENGPRLWDVDSQCLWMGRMDGWEVRERRLFGERRGWDGLTDWWER